MVDRKPRVSVLTTAYNPGRYLDIALEGLRQQSFEDFEHVLMDNGCGDGSIESLRQPHDPRLRLTRYEENIGRTPALRKAFEAARGEYVAILDADDVWHPDHLQRQVEWLDAHQRVVLVGTWCRWIDESGSEYNRTEPPTQMGPICQKMAWENPYANSSTMFRRDAAIGQGGYDDDYPFAQDFDLWLKLVQVGDANILPEFLTDIRVLSNSISRSPEHNLSKAYDEFRLYRRAAKQFTLDRRTRYRNRKVVAASAVTYGIALQYAGKQAEGWKWKMWGLTQDPLVFLRKKLGNRVRSIAARIGLT